MKTKIRPKSKEKKLLLNLLESGRQRHRHRVALVTEEGEWNQHEPNSGMARMFVVMLLVHVVLIGGIIIYDFMGDDAKPQQSATQAARAMGSASGLPQASPEIVNAQARAAADTEQYDSYEMRSGDSLKSIAAKFGATEEEITKLNLIDKGLQIGPGTMLRVPKQAVPAAIPVDPKTLKPLAAAEVPKAIPVKDQPPATVKVPSEAVRPSEAPASLSAAAITPMSLVAPNELPPETSSLSSAANAPATAPVAPQTVAALPPPAKPKASSLLQEEVEEAPAAPAPVKEKEQSRPVIASMEAPAQSQPKPLAKPAPVAPPSQMLKKIASAPPAAKKPEPARKTADTPPKPAARPASARTHVLQSGETLYRLSSKYGVSVAALQKANNIKNPNAMREGMKLVIPAK